MYSVFGVSSLLSVSIVLIAKPYVGFAGIFSICFLFSLTAAFLAFKLKEN
jgi:hypothetical protein